MKLEIYCGVDAYGRPDYRYLGNPDLDDFPIHVMLDRPKDYIQTNGLLFEKFCLLKGDQTDEIATSVGQMGQNYDWEFRWESSKFNMTLNIMYKLKYVDNSSSASGNSYWLITGAVKVQRYAGVELKIPQEHVGEIRDILKKNNFKFLISE